MGIELKVPAVGESISEVEIGAWKKTKGDAVEPDEILVVLETDKATVDLPSPVRGILGEQLKQQGETARVGEVIAYLEESAESPAAKAQQAPAQTKADSPKKTEPRSTEPPQPRVMPAAQRALAEQGLRAEEVQPTGPGGRLLKEDVLRHVEASGRAREAGLGPTELGQPPAVQPQTPSGPQPMPPSGDRQEQVVPMSRLRRTVGERLVQAQHNAALLTTFNEADLSAVLAMRKEFGEAFLARHRVKLGFMSFFVKASIDALKLVPQVNAEIRGKDIVFRSYCDIGVAIGGGKGLVVPVLRSADTMSFAQVELAIADFGKRAKENKLKPDELQGGTFTISNGGVYGSLLSTPIVNPPQSGVLGMHAIQERPVAREGQVVIRPMMYLALTYDHRLVDGREAVTFLKRIKDVIENPARLLMEV